MLEGERPAESFFDRLLRATVSTAFLAPFLLMGVGMVIVGLLALGPRRDMPELLICLPAGLALLVLIVGVLWYVAIRIPSLTVERFAFDGAQLAIDLPKRGRFIGAVVPSIEIAEQRGRRGRGLRGWWLRFDEIGWIYLSKDFPNAGELVGLLRESRHS
ncbi:MAG: hypothetical protein SFX72_08065 [Isosphaeraceae bacterium]|nr:hypothetical protein [Isosphaeraceae bacterium]